MIQTFRAKLHIETQGKNKLAKVTLPAGSFPFTKLYNLTIEMNGEDFKTKLWNNSGSAGFYVPIQVVRKLNLRDSDLVRFRIKK